MAQPSPGRANLVVFGHLRSGTTALSECTTSRSVALSRITIKMVSSPAMVPRI